MAVSRLESGVVSDSPGCRSPLHHRDIILRPDRRDCGPAGGSRAGSPGVEADCSGREYRDQYRGCEQHPGDLPRGGGAAYKLPLGGGGAAAAMTWTKACRQPGIVGGRKNTLLASVSGKSTTLPMLMTACGERTSKPMVVHTQDGLSEKTSKTPIPAATPCAPSAGRNPKATPRMTTRLAASR